MILVKHTQMIEFQNVRDDIHAMQSEFLLFLNQNNDGFKLSNHYI